jgi:hypothetical protein
MARITCGTPASTKTLPIVKPGGDWPGPFRAPARHHHGDDLRMLLELDPKSRRHSVSRDVVVRRPDAAGGDHVVVAAAQGVERGDDLLMHIRHGPRLGKVHAVHTQVLGDVAQISVLRPPRQDLIADYQHRGGDPPPGLASRLTSGLAARHPLIPRLHPHVPDRRTKAFHGLPATA